MKLSVSSYSYHQLTDNGSHTMLSLISLAEEMGFDGIEFTDLMPPEGVSEADYAVQLRREAERCGIAIVSYTIGANLLAPDERAEVERVKRKADIAALLGAPVLRHDLYFAFPQQDGENACFDDYLDKVVRLSREITEYAAKKGVKTCTENHGLICQDSERVEKVIRGVNHDNFGWLVDVGNFRCADEHSAEAVRRAAPYAFHVHLKDFSFAKENEGFATRSGKRIQGCVLGEGMIPVLTCVRMLQKASYQGYYTVEYEGSEDCLKAIPRAIRYLKAFDA